MSISLRLRLLRKRESRLEPREFLNKYARLKEGEWGYKTNWERTLEYALGVSRKTVQSWGMPEFEKMPQHHRHRLAELNALLVAEAVLESHGLGRAYLSQL